MRRSLSKLAILLSLLLVAPALAQDAEKSLVKCEKAAAKMTSKFAQIYQKTLAGCVDQIAKEVIQTGGSSASAVKKCSSRLRALVNSEKPDKTLAAKFETKVGKLCDPDHPSTSAAHTAADVLGTGASVAQPLLAENLAGWCANFSGDGALDSVAKWTDCLEQAATCSALSSLSTTYPRLIEWLGQLRFGLLDLDSSCDFECGSCEDAAVADACTAVETIVAAIDRDGDERPDLGCGHAGCGLGGFSGNWTTDGGCTLNIEQTTDGSASGEIGISVSCGASALYLGSPAFSTTFSGTIDVEDGSFSVTENGMTVCPIGLLVTGTVALDCALMQGSWDCAGLLSGSFNASKG